MPVSFSPSTMMMKNKNPRRRMDRFRSFRKFYTSNYIATSSTATTTTTEPKRPPYVKLVEEEIEEQKHDEVHDNDWQTTRQHQYYDNIIKKRYYMNHRNRYKTNNMDSTFLTSTFSILCTISEEASSEERTTTSDEFQIMKLQQMVEQEKRDDCNISSTSTLHEIQLDHNNNTSRLSLDDNKMTRKDLGSNNYTYDHYQPLQDDREECNLGIATNHHRVHSVQREDVVQESRNDNTDIAFHRISLINDYYNENNNDDEISEALTITTIEDDDDDEDTISDDDNEIDLAEDEIYEYRLVQSSHEFLKTLIDNDIVRVDQIIDEMKTDVDRINDDVDLICGRQLKHNDMNGSGTAVHHKRRFNLQQVIQEQCTLFEVMNHNEATEMTTNTKTNNVNSKSVMWYPVYTSTNPKIPLYWEKNTNVQTLDSRE